MKSVMSKAIVRWHCAYPFLSFALAAALRITPQNSSLRSSAFDESLYGGSLRVLQSGSQKRLLPSYALHKPAHVGPHCDLGSSAASQKGAALAQHPGGATQRKLGKDFAQQILALSEQARGARGASLVLPTFLARQGVELGAGMVQAMAAAAVHILPPLIPPPAWTNQPLPCAPMVTGHNCFGAVLYPITMADFVIADVTDTVMDGYIDGFPNTYASKVGSTDDATYKGCFASYMSLQCSSLFPRCLGPGPLSGQRTPTCLHLCVIPLVMCPGFWIGDVLGPCQTISVPPTCTQAFFWNLWKLPPQYQTYDEAHPFPEGCSGGDSKGPDSASDDPSLYDEWSTEANPLASLANETRASKSASLTP